ncbi:MAG TPA: hypothetical protein VG986_12970 [Pseudolabrys sp.]|nr:hypothetical protein [Pseudolabrys sp.]
MSARAVWLMAGCAAAVLGGLAGAAFAQDAPGAGARRFELPPIENLQATRERPLFTPTRRPPAIVVAPEAPPPIVESVALPFELTGIAVGEDVRIAILHNKTTNEELRLRQGDKLDDWMLEQVADRYILLRGEGRRVRVWLVSNAKPPGIEVRQVDGAVESTAAVPPPAGEVDQEVVPSAPPAARAPAPPPVPPPVARRPPRPPVPPRAGIGMRPEVRRQLHRN